MSRIPSQSSFLPPSRKEHGGILSLGRRRSRRPLSTKQALHITLRSELAHGPRSLLRHRKMIDHIARKFSRRFGVRIYRYAVCGNHLHFLIRGRYREDIQNFFRVLSGHIAQNILREFPLTAREQLAQQVAGGAPTGEPRAWKKPPHPKNRRKFWALLIYSRVLSWGREYRTVSAYIVQNVLEALCLIAYRPRKIRLRKKINSSA